MEKTRPRLRPLSWIRFLTLHIQRFTSSHNGRGRRPILSRLRQGHGQTIWRTDRSTDFKDLDANGNPKRDGDERKCYSTPIIVNVDGRDLLISPGAKAAWAYEPLTGKPVWQFLLQEPLQRQSPSIQQWSALHQFWILRRRTLCGKTKRHRRHY